MGWFGSSEGARSSGAGAKATGADPNVIPKGWGVRGNVNIASNQDLQGFRNSQPAGRQTHAQAQGGLVNRWDPYAGQPYQPPTHGFFNQQYGGSQGGAQGGHPQGWTPLYDRQQPVQGQNLGNLSQPMQIAGQQFGINTGAADAQQRMNMIGQTDMRGNTLSWSQGPGQLVRDPVTGQEYHIPSYHASQTLNPQDQQILDQQRQGQIGAGGLFNSMLGQNFGQNPQEGLPRAFNLEDPWVSGRVLEAMNDHSTQFGGGGDFNFGGGGSQGPLGGESGSELSSYGQMQKSQHDRLLSAVQSGGVEVGEDGSVLLGGVNYNNPLTRSMQANVAAGKDPLDGINLDDHQFQGSGRDLANWQSKRGRSGGSSSGGSSGGGIPGFNPNAYGGLTRNVAQPHLTRTYDSGGPIQQTYDSGGPIQRSYDSGGPITRSVAGGGPRTRSAGVVGVQGAGQLQRGIRGMGQLTHNVGTQGIANAGNIQRGVQGLGDLSYSGGNVGVEGAGDIQRGIGGIQGLQRSAGMQGIGDAGDITRSYSGDFSADRQRVEQGLLSRVNQDYERDRGQLEERLASQGIRVGSQAYKDAMEDHSRSLASSRFEALRQGGAEHSRLTGLDRDRALFQNQAQGQQFGQNLAASQHMTGQRQFNLQANNAAAQQQFDAGARQGQFANQAQAQQYGQNLSDAQTQIGQNQFNSQLNNQAQQQRFQAGVTQGQFANQAQNQQYAQNSGDASFLVGQNQFNAGLNNQAQQQRFQSGLQQGQFANQAQGQQFGQNMGLAQFQSGQQQFNANLNNQASNSQFQENLGIGQFQNQAQGQQNTQNLQAGQFANQAQNQQNQQNLQAGQFWNQGQQQRNTQNLQAANFYNQAGLNQFGMGMQNANLNNQAQGQAFGQGLAGYQANLQGQSQQFNQGLAQFQAQNQAAMQRSQFAEQLRQNAQADRQQQFAQNLAAGGFNQQQMAMLWGMMNPDTSGGWINTPGAQVDAPNLAGIIHGQGQLDEAAKSRRYGLGMGILNAGVTASGNFGD